MRAYYNVDALVDDVLDQAAKHESLKDVKLTTVALCEEVGEVAGVIKKHYRDGKSLDELPCELGDVLFYLIAMCQNYGVSLDDIARICLSKLKARRAAKALVP